MKKIALLIVMAAAAAFAATPAPTQPKTLDEALLLIAQLRNENAELRRQLAELRAPPSDAIAKAIQNHIPAVGMAAVQFHALGGIEKLTGETRSSSDFTYEVWLPWPGEEFRRVPVECRLTIVDGKITWITWTNRPAWLK